MRIKITRGLSREIIKDYEDYQKLINNKEVIKTELDSLKQDYEKVKQEIAKLESPQEPLPYNEIVMRAQSAGKRIPSYQDYQTDVSKYHDALKQYDSHPSVKAGKALVEELAIKTAEWELVQAQGHIILEEKDFDETGELKNKVSSQLETLNIKGTQVTALVNEYQSSLLVKQQLENHIKGALENPKGLYPSEVVLLKQCQDILSHPRNPPATKLEQVSKTISQPPPKRGWSEKFIRLLDKIMNVIKPTSKRQEPRFKQEIGKIKDKLEERSSAPKPKSPRP